MTIEVDLHITEDEIRGDREEAIKKIPERYGDADPLVWLNEVAYREALHASYIFQESVDNYLVEHPCVILDPAAYRLATIASNALYELYQRIGNLSADVEDKS